MRQEIFEVSEQGMAVEELARLLAIGASEVVKVLFMKGIMVQVNQASEHILRILQLPPHRHCCMWYYNIRVSALSCMWMYIRNSVVIYTAAVASS